VKGPYFLTQALLPVLADGASIVNVSGGMVRDNPEDHRMVSSVTALGRPGEAGDIGAAIAALLRAMTTGGSPASGLRCPGACSSKAVSRRSCSRLVN
jgi:NAD(P)-dependent dehydrogenase (short-subunit alcohol dehydrogenase family)